MRLLCEQCTCSADEALEVKILNEGLIEFLTAN